MDKEKNTEKNIDEKSKETSKRKYKRWLQSFINNDIDENLFGDLNKEFDNTPMHIKQSNIFANDEEALLIAQKKSLEQNDTSDTDSESGIFSWDDDCLSNDNNVNSSSKGKEPEKQPALDSSFINIQSNNIADEQFLLFGTEEEAAEAALKLSREEYYNQTKQKTLDVSSSSSTTAKKETQNTPYDTQDVLDNNIVISKSNFDKNEIIDPDLAAAIALSLNQDTMDNTNSSPKDMLSTDNKSVDPDLAAAIELSLKQGTMDNTNSSPKDMLSTDNESVDSDVDAAIALSNHDLVQNSVSSPVFARGKRKFSDPYPHTPSTDKKKAKEPTEQPTKKLKTEQKPRLN